MKKIINADTIPKTLTDDILDLEVGKALEISRKKQAQALSIVSYYKNKTDYASRIYRSRKKDRHNCYIIREA